MLRIVVASLLTLAGVALILIGLLGFVLPVLPGIPFFVVGASLLLATVPPLDRWFKRVFPRLAHGFDAVSHRFGERLSGRKNWRTLCPDLLVLVRSHCRMCGIKPSPEKPVAAAGVKSAGKADR